MRRREFISLVGAAASSISWPLTAGAQQRERVRRIGVLFAAYTQTDQAGRVRVATFLDTLRAHGWNDGRNIQFDYRWGEGKLDRIRTLAAQIVQSAPDVIVVAGDPALAQLQQLKSPIPIAFTQVSEAVGSGFVASLARPGGSITGFQNFEPAMGGKWLGVLKEALPSLTRAGVLFSEDVPHHTSFLRAVEAVAPSLAVTVTVIGVHDRGKIESAIAAFAGSPHSGLIVFPHPNTIANRQAIMAMALHHRLPAIYPYRYFTSDGGLISYGPDQIDQWRGVAVYVDRILKGEKPADLPVQAPTRYELALNLKTAKALGLDLPASLLARADEVIE
jgi:putative tryptophan/tyrosine transport system substrate-binding protein